jgi:hypothetical protein
MLTLSLQGRDRVAALRQVAERGSRAEGGGVSRLPKPTTITVFPGATKVSDFGTRYPRNEQDLVTIARLWRC